MPISEKLQRAIDTAGAWARNSIDRGIQRSIDPNYILALIEAIPTSDAERHDRAVPVAWEVRRSDNEEWSLVRSSDGYSDRYERRPLYAAPPPPAAVQEPVAVKVKPLEWDNFGRAFSEVGTYNVVCIRSGVFGLTKPEDEGATFPISREGSERYCRDEAQFDYEQRIRSALSTSQSDPAPEIAALRAENERLQDKVDGLEADLDSAVEVAFRHGAHEWTRLNYPTHFERLFSDAVAPEQEEVGE
ncbi:hypothetical protein G6L15_08310 [Agrobacterium rhizogenes]|uniref:hypothetical protein n=1 Tax=Rhizobium rhizogenes TaxID=359 RepID=UPI001573FF0F|nr:hypothetical protein [Rhizobium rhizogenes]NTG86147.1 hypothetical protein [Rhizobium rhizogenes]